jgi:hypothetical protein
MEGRGRAGGTRKQRPPRSGLRQHAGRLRIEILENKNQSAPIESASTSFLPEAAIRQSQAWYGKIFGAKASERNNAPVADIPGVQLRFAKAENAQAPTKGRILDHIGFDVRDLKAFIKTLEANNIKLDRPYTVNDSGVGIAFITDPWLHRISTSGLGNKADRPERRNCRGPVESRGPIAVMTAPRDRTPGSSVPSAVDAAAGVPIWDQVRVELPN